MKHIKQDFSLKAWVQSPGVDLGGGAKAKFFSQPKHMLWVLKRTVSMRQRVNHFTNFQAFNGRIKSNHQNIIAFHYIFDPWEIFHSFLSSAAFFQINFFKKLFLEYHLSVKQFGSRSGPTFDLRPICLQKLSADDTSR